MKKTILITGSTDGIGLATATSLLELGHTVILHGRSESKLAAAKKQLSEIASTDKIFAYKADLSIISDVNNLASEIKNNHQKLDVLINNAGILIVPEPLSEDGVDIRFMVNTIAPYLLTKLLLPLLDKNARIINLSSATQAPVAREELLKVSSLTDHTVYAKSKLAITMWSRQMSLILGKEGPIVVAINPKSLLGSKMVKQGYGIAGGNLQLGADILVKASLSDEFADASGLYFDNDIEAFTAPHPDALNADKISKMTEVLETFIK
ncbi:SDR family NAD(P)-dependent oxidoreductase [Psychromonas sp. KJ10-10]|uniref:SDR family NAD(P)-dependent oxidoreductase n=1 Tax=Psychromonas sp. KJ10-10 TaxID=3391823 RepID=UPI0039B39A7A